MCKKNECLNKCKNCKNTVDDGAEGVLSYPNVEEHIIFVKDTGGVEMIDYGMEE